MKLKIYFLLVLFFFLGNNILFSEKLSQIQNSLTQSLNNAIKSSLYNDVNLGICISTIDNKILYSHDPDRPYVTASAVKIFPSAISMIKFGPEHKFLTLILADNDPVNGVINGNLYIQGKGDPSLKLKNLQDAIKELKDKGIKKVAGDIVYDITYLDEEENRFAPNARNLYAPPCALTLNYNWIDIIIHNGPPVNLQMAPVTSYAKLSYDVSVSPAAAPGRPAMTYRKCDWGDQYSIKGTITGWDKKYHYVCLGVSRPGLYAATLFKEECKKAGIEVTGSIKKAAASKNAKVFITISSIPLKEIVAVMNQESNNVIAEMLNKNLGASFISVPGTREKGLTVQKNYCVDLLNFKQNEFKISDGSGLSMSNRISPNQFIKALNSFYKDKKIRDAFLPTLAWQGHHPHSMLPVPPDNIKMMVKTGTLSVTGVNTVVGYILLDGYSEVFSFAILANRVKTGPMTYSGTLTNPLLYAIVEALKNGL